MRILHILFAVFMLAMALTVAREPVGRVAIVVFVTLGGELICGLAAVMLLFQTVGSIGESRGVLEYVQCLMATAVVLVVSTGLMLAMLSLCVTTINRVI